MQTNWPQTNITQMYGCERVVRLIIVGRVDEKSLDLPHPMTIDNWSTVALGGEHHGTNIQYDLTSEDAVA